MGNQFSRGAFTLRRPRHRLAERNVHLGHAGVAPESCSECVASRRWTREASAPGARRTTSPIRGGCVPIDARSRHPLAYVPPWLDKGGDADQRRPARTTTPALPVRTCRAIRCSCASASGDFYQDSPIRFAPNIQTSRNGELGDRLIDDDKKNFAPRRRLGVDAEPELVGALRRRCLLHAGHRQPALRHGPQRGGPPPGHGRPAARQSELGRPVPPDRAATPATCSRRSYAW